MGLLNFLCQLLLWISILISLTSADIIQEIDDGVVFMWETLCFSVATSYMLCTFVIS